MSNSAKSVSVLALIIALGAFFPLANSHAGSLKVLYAFHGANGGGTPYAGLISDENGNLYGTTAYGGNSDFGVVFKLAPDGTETVLHSFSGGADGRLPGADLIVDREGNFYGTTYLGGGGQCSLGCGAVFKLATDGTESVLHSFMGSADGAYPVSGVTADMAGNLFGTTQSGGTGCSRNDCGTVFRLSPDGAYTVLHSFEGGRDDGARPWGDLVIDDSGTIFGTTTRAGRGVEAKAKRGVVFKISPDGTEALLHRFKGGGYGDGRYPMAGLLADNMGNLYGTTELGGAYERGTVFRLAQDGTYTVLYSFKGKRDGRGPRSELIMDPAGNLYGTTWSSGEGNGTVFRLAPDGTHTVLYSFKGQGDGGRPNGSLIMDSEGNLYGTTIYGAYGYGVVFEVTP